MILRTRESRVFPLTPTLSPHPNPLPISRLMQEMGEGVKAKAPDSSPTSLIGDPVLIVGNDKSGYFRVNDSRCASQAHLTNWPIGQVKATYK